MIEEINIYCIFSITFFSITYIKFYIMIFILYKLIILYVLS